jgi:hypothetical protein
VIGCTAESVIGAAQEIEGRPGIALWAACLPGTDVRYFEVTAKNGSDGEPAFSALPSPNDAEHSCLLLLADPYSFPVDCYLGQLNESLPGVPAMGGMSSGAMGPGQTLFFTADGVRDSGAVGVVLEGAIQLRPGRQPGLPADREAVGRHRLRPQPDQEARRTLGARGADGDVQRPGGPRTARSCRARRSSAWPWTRRAPSSRVATSSCAASSG